MADWEKIKAEYITNANTSYRKLAEKYGVHYKTISSKGKDEGWAELRSQHTHSILTKTLDCDINQKVDRAAKLCNAADVLLEKIVAGMTKGDSIAPNAAKNYSDAMKNIKEILMIKSAEDIEEQRARIEKLRKDVSEDKNEPIRVIIDDSIEEYGK